MKAGSGLGELGCLEKRTSEAGVTGHSWALKITLIQTRTSTHAFKLVHTDGCIYSHTHTQGKQLNSSVLVSCSTSAGPVCAEFPWSFTSSPCWSGRREGPSPINKQASVTLTSTTKHFPSVAAEKPTQTLKWVYQLLAKRRTWWCWREKNIWREGKRFQQVKAHRIDVPELFGTLYQWMFWSMHFKQVLCYTSHAETGKWLSLHPDFFYIYTVHSLPFLRKIASK